MSHARKHKINLKKKKKRKRIRKRKEKKRKREKEIWAPGGVFGILVDQEFWDLVPDVEGHKMKGGQEAANRNLDWRVGTSNIAAAVPALLTCGSSGPWFWADPRTCHV
jgi:hypothetical protein